jgi:hypothetical protein
LKWLLQRRRLAIWLRHAALAVTRGEHERQAARDQNLDHRRNRLAVEIDVEDRHVELACFASVTASSIRPASPASV